MKAEKAFIRTLCVYGDMISIKSLSQCSHGAAGEVEVFTGITPGSNVKLVPYIFNSHLEFLELIFTLGETSATVHTKKPLDADLLAAVSSTKPRLLEY